MSEEEGQALVVVVFVLALAAMMVVAIRVAQDRLLVAARSERAGEAAVEAAVASVADAYMAAEGARSSPIRLRELLANPEVRRSASSAAAQLASANAGGGIESLDLTCGNGRVEAHLILDGREHRAGFDAPECSRP